LVKSTSSGEVSSVYGLRTFKLNVNSDAQTLVIGNAHYEEGLRGALSLSNRADAKGYTTITPKATSNISINLPSTEGTLALTSQIPANLSAFTNDAGYLTSFTEEDPTVPAWAKAASKPTYTAAEVGALPDTTVIPAAQVNSDWNATSGVAQILNKPTIPNVPAWALAANKPTYTASEVGALPSTYTAPVTSVNG